MNKNTILAAPLAIALAALSLSVTSRIPVELMVGYGMVLALLAVIGVEYQISWKRIFGRR